jgi:sulfur carrier protein
MRISLNGSPHELTDDTTVAALLDSVVGSSRGSAVAVDGEVVPRSTWSAVTLRDGQDVELITAVQGG